MKKFNKIRAENKKMLYEKLNKPTEVNKLIHKILDENIKLNLLDICHVDTNRVLITMNCNNVIFMQLWNNQDKYDYNGFLPDKKDIKQYGFSSGGVIELKDKTAVNMLKDYLKTIKK